MKTDHGANNGLVTKKELKQEFVSFEKRFERKMGTKMAAMETRLHGEIYRTKTELQQGIQQNAAGLKDQFLNGWDKVMGELTIIREEQAAHFLAH